MAGTAAAVKITVDESLVSGNDHGHTSSHPVCVSSHQVMAPFNELAGTSSQQLLSKASGKKSHKSRASSSSNTVSSASRLVGRGWNPTTFSSYDENSK